MTYEPPFPSRSTTGALLGWAQHRLIATSTSAQLDAELLLAFVLQRPRTWLHAWPDYRLAAEPQVNFEALVERRARGEPVAHLVGEREFWSLRLEVDADTLIPRPETELLVEQALMHLPEETTCRIADLGTGSGAVALAIASERPAITVVATDISASALAVARRNAERLGLRNVEFRQGDWLAALAGERFPLIVSNPPYIADGDPHLATGDLRFEPRTALAAGPAGLDALAQIIDAARTRLAAAGVLLLEHGFDQQEAVIQLLRNAGYLEISGHTDLNDQHRVVTARWQTFD